MILSLLKGIGSTIMVYKDVYSVLSLLLERRSRFYSDLDKSCQKLSKSEIEMICLLLEVSQWMFLNDCFVCLVIVFNFTS